ncbi:MAG: ATP synthase F0 subunit B, partial [Cyanobacteria bacterium P01_F01_bin.153]
MFSNSTPGTAANNAPSDSPAGSVGMAAPEPVIQGPNSPDAASKVNGAAENGNDSGSSAGNTGSNIQLELNRLEEMVLDSPRVPFGRRTLIDEEQLLDQLDTIRLSLPAAFREAEAIVRQREQILTEAQRQAQEIIGMAKQQASRSVEETAVMRQAQMDAEILRQQVDEECAVARQQLLAELDQTRESTILELEELRRTAIAECEAIQDGADDYADRVLSNIERQLSEMLRVIRNGRQQLQQDSDQVTQATNAAKAN